MWSDSRPTANKPLGALLRLERWTLAGLLWAISYVGVIPYAAAQAPEIIEFSLANSVLDKLPVFQSVVFDGAPQKAEVDLGKKFIGDAIVGAIRVTNTTNQTLSIDSVKASCGCTTAHPSVSTVAPSESAKILTRMQLAKGGAFSNSVEVATSAGVALVTFSGTAQMRVGLVDETVRVAMDSNAIEFQVQVNDPQLDWSDLQLRSDSKTTVTKLEKLSPTTCAFSVLLSGTPAPVSTICLVPFTHDKELEPLYLKVTRAGTVKVTPSNVYGSVTDGELRFRVFISGDISEADRQVREGTLVLSDGKSRLSKQVGISSKSLGTSQLLAVALAFDSGLDAFEGSDMQASLTIGEKVLLFTLSRR